MGGLPDDSGTEIVYDGAVAAADIREWEGELRSLISRLDGLFHRTESKRHAEQYLRGLLAPLERKNGWTIAEHVGEDKPDRVQRLLNLTPRDAAELLAVNRGYAMEHLADPGAVLVADPTGFAKKGTKSVGVQRQYSGTLGRVDNCQIATFLAYVAPGRDRVLIDRRLYLPAESWIGDPARRAEAGVPADVEFATRPEQVADMIDDAVAAGVPFSWFAADEEFGQNPGLCAHLEDAAIGYVMAIPKNTWLADASGARVRIDRAAARLGAAAWSRRACGIGAKGHRACDWARCGSAEPDRCYLIRRGIDTGELAYYRCYSPRRATTGELVNVAGARWPIEECFGSGKNEVGLDNYQVRKYDPWHRHITLAMLAHTFLAVTAHHAKKRAPKTPGHPIRPTTPTTTPHGPESADASTGNSSTSPSPKSADSSTRSAAAKTPSTRRWAGPTGDDDIRPVPAARTSDGTSGGRR